MSKYLFRVSGTTGTSSWSVERSCADNEIAIGLARDLAKEFVGMKGFMSLCVWDIETVDGRLVACVKLSEPEAIVDLKWAEIN